MTQSTIFRLLRAMMTTNLAQDPYGAPEDAHHYVLCNAHEN